MITQQNQVLTGISNSVVGVIFFTTILGIMNIYYFFKSFRIQRISNYFHNYLRRQLNDQEPNVQVQDNSFNQNDPCSLCLNPICLPIQFLCRHEFCAQCVLSYLNARRYAQIQCPYCRANVTMMIRKYENRNNFQETDQTREISSKIKQYNRRYGNNDRPFLQRIRDMPFLIESSIRYIFTWQGFVYFLSRFIFTYRFFIPIIYLLSPFDLIPEFIFGAIGLIDDLIVLIFLFLMFSNVVYAFFMNREQN